MAIVCTLLPHTAHLRGIRLEVSEILFAQAGLFVDFYCVAGEGGGGGRVGGQGVEDSFCGFAGAAVGGGEEMEGIVWTE